MQKIFNNNIVAVILAFAAASLMMMICESINSLIFPFPADMDKTNLDAVRAFTATMPYTGYILVAIGWLSGSAVGAYMLEKFSKSESRKRNVLILIAVLTLLGLFNNIMLGAPVIFTILGLFVFYIGGRAGVWLANKNII